MTRKLIVHGKDGRLVMLNTDKIDAIYDYVPSDDSRNKFENFKTFERRKAKESCTKIHMGEHVFNVQESTGQIDVMLAKAFGDEE
jgi:hypothetical protein